MELRIEVERLVEHPQTRGRFREMIRDWSTAITDKLHADRDQLRKRVEQFGLTNAADGDEASPLRFPLPVGIQKPSLQERYVALAMIHDALNEPDHQLNPWQDIQGDSTVDPFAFVVRFKLDHSVPQFQEVFPESAEPLLRIALEDVKNDLKEMFPASDERRENPVDLAGAESGVKSVRQQGNDPLSALLDELTSNQVKIVRFLWSHLHSVDWRSLPNDAFRDGEGRQDEAVKRALERLQGRLNELYERFHVELEINAETRRVRLEKPPQTNADK